ncbi:MAG TPA: RhuM family protein [Candidatus Deferrimicrobium sp.]|nr:RhuM family protein [Candidatus Deferrimicrobium sp.]
MEDETVWLTQDQMADLYGKSKSTINEHIKNVYEEQELTEESTMRKFGISEFSTKPTNFYNLDVIISVGYRVKSVQGTQFRIWATQRIKEYIIKGFTLDDERLKQGGQKARYFQELLQRKRRGISRSSRETRREKEMAKNLSDRSDLSERIREKAA